MMNTRKAITSIIMCLVMLLIGMTSVFAAVGWINDGWSGPNWLYKACNSKTTVFDSPQYTYMSATAKIGTYVSKKEQSNPSPNMSVHAVANSGYNETCYTWGNVR